MERGAGWEIIQSYQSPHLQKTQVDDMLALANRHVIEARIIVERQRRMVRQLLAAGTDAADAKHTLDVFERILKIFEEHLQALNRELPAPSSRR